MAEFLFATSGFVLATVALGLVRILRGPADADRMTVDDVVVRTVGLLARTALSGAAAWIIVPDRVAPAFWEGRWSRGW